MFLGYARYPYIRYTTHNVTRSLPGNAQVLVKVGDEVRPEKIVGIGKKSAGFRTVDATSVLGVQAKDLKNHLNKTVGSYINKGEVIAQRSSLMGIQKKELKSPVDGILRHINDQTGVLTLEYRPEEMRVVSGVKGTVTEIDPQKNEITISTNVLEVHGSLGIGKRREGSIHVVGQPDLPLSEKQIDPTWENKIVVGGSLLTKQVLYHCVALKVQGIVVGGIHWEDFATLIGTRGRFEDIGISVIVTEGFGNLPIPIKLFEQLQSFEGKFSFVWGGTARLLIPHQEVSGAKPQEHIDSPTRYTRLTEGMRVRLLTLERGGDFGTIRQLVEDTYLPSGIRTSTAQVELYNGETIRVPTTELEVVPETSDVVTTSVTG
jgi:hypothetical protein